MKKLILAASLTVFLAAIGTADAATVYTFNASGNWVCPPGITSIQVECWGGGGAGGAAKATSGSGLAGGGGGGGGAYALTSLAVTPGNSYSVTVGGGGSSAGGNSSAGSPSSFTGDSATISANGGSAGASVSANGFGAGGPGGATNAAGISFAGGSGALAVSGTGGGGGGSGAGTAVSGSNGTTATGGVAPAGGGSGGSGGNSSADGALGFFPGGGGSGAYSKSTSQRNGGAGGGGQVVITVASPFSFTPGNLAVLLPGDTGANNTTLNILELDPAAPGQAFAYSVPVDGTSANGLRFSGSAGTSGYLANSGDGTLLTFTGANTNNNTIAVNAIAARGVGSMNASGSYSLRTTYTATVSPTTQPRGASSGDDLNWVIGDQGGMYTNGSTAPAPAGNFRAVKSFGGVNYVLNTTAGVPVVMSYSGGTTNYLPGIPTNSNGSDFYLISSGQNGPLFDVMYVLDSTSATAGTISKFALAGGTWSAQGTYGTGAGGVGLCVAVSGGVANLYFTTGNGNSSNSVVLVTDSASPLNSILQGSPETVLYTAGAGAQLKGIAFAPVAAAPVVATTAATSIGTTGAIMNGSVLSDGGAPLTDYGFYRSITSPVTTNSTKGQVGTTDISGNYSAGLTGLSVNTQYFYRAYADNSVGNTLDGVDVTFWTLANTPAAPTVGTPTTTTLNVAIGSGDGNPVNTTYAIQETTGGNFVQANGSLGATAVFQTASVWGGKTVTGLIPNTTYTFQVEAQNGALVPTSFGGTASGTTTTPPTPSISVTPNSLAFPPTLLGGTSANLTNTVSGVNLTANIVITAPANFQVSTSSSSGFGSSVALSPSSGTVPDTLVYVRFQPVSQITYSNNIALTSSGANNPNVTVSGIGALPPSVTTQAANPTNTTSATLNGTVTATNGAPLTDRGFYWSASPGVTTSSTQLSEGGTSLGGFSKALSGLSVNTIYYYRAYAVNSVGLTLDGTDVSFYTLAKTPVAPVVGSPTTNTLTVAIGSGDGNPAATTYAIQEANSGNFVQADGSLAGAAVFQTASVWGTKTVTGLNFGTQYNFKVEAQNSAGVTTAFGPATIGFTSNQPFTPGNVAVLSASVASANNSAFTIVELNPTNPGVAVQVVPINATTGTNALRTSGSAGTTPKLANSADGSLLVFVGSNTTNSSGNANSFTNRAVGTLDPSNNFKLQTTYIGTSGNQARSAASIDNQTWYIGDQAGIYTNHATTPLETDNIVSLKAFGSTVYALRASGSKVAVSSVSADGTTLTGLPGLPAGDSSAVDFYLLSSGSNGNAFDILYILDKTSTTVGAINKFYLSAGMWNSSGTAYATTIGGFGLAAAISGTNSAELYVTSGDGTVASNSVYQFADSFANGWNSAINITEGPNLLYSATGGATLKGVAFAPAVPFVVTMTNLGGGMLQLSWPFGTLQGSTNLPGNFSDITNVSPYTVPASQARQFFRVRK